MIKKASLTILIPVAVALVIVGGVANAQTASGLVLKKIGVSTPEVKPYHEIPVGMTISLFPGTRLTFQHYHTCRTVTVVGGEVQFGSEIYTITGGSREKYTRTPCPRTMILKVGATSGGIMMRGFSTLALSTRPSFVLVGRRAGEFSSVRVSKSNTVLLRASVEGRRIKWPVDAEPLSADTEYELTLIPTTASHKPVTKKFRVMAPEAARAARGLLLIRVD